MWCDHALFRDSLWSLGSDLLYTSLPPNLKSLCSTTTKIWNAMQNVEIKVVWELMLTQGNQQCHHSGARDNEWLWHQLGHMQVYTLPQTDNHASTPPLRFLQAGCPSCCPTNSVKALCNSHTSGNISCFNSLCLHTNLKAHVACLFFITVRSGCTKLS